MWQRGLIEFDSPNHERHSLNADRMGVTTNLPNMSPGDFLGAALTGRFRPFVVVALGFWAYNLIFFWSDGN